MSEDLRRRDDEERGYQRAMLESILKGQETLRQDVEVWREEMTKRLDHHSERLRILEQARAWVMGVAAAIGAAGGWIGSHIGGTSK